MNAKGYFKPFFAESKGDLQQHERVIAYWLSTFVRRKHPELLLEIIEAQHQCLARPFSQIFGHIVWAEDSKSPDPNSSIWVSLLLSQGEHVLSQDMWAYLLKKCHVPKGAGIALRLFELLTTPRIHLKKRFAVPAFIAASEQEKRDRISKKEMDYDIVWPEGSRYWLGQAWQTVL